MREVGCTRRASDARDQVTCIRKKKHANDFSLRRTCHWHLLGAIGSCLAVNWQVGQLIDFLFSCTTLYSVTILAFYVTWSRALARASIGGVERQNLSICINRSFVNNLFFP
jgi:hypothetical protein